MDSRRDQRKQMAKSGKIVFDWGRSTIDCTIIDLSAGGAALTVKSTAGIPAEFNLILTQDNVVKSCRVVWKKETQVGLVFLHT